MKQAWTFESPGNQVVRCIDFNPNKQYYLVSSGDDAALRFWDTRNLKRALAVRNDHSHWVCTPGIFFYAKVFETTRYIYLIYLIYRTRAIITRGLYIFTPFFSAIYNQKQLILQTIYVLNKVIWA